MTLNLTQKERTMLQDQKKHEDICVKKYNDYASRAQSPELKQLFSSYATKEQEHLDSINQMINGQIPQMGQQQSQQQQNQQQGQQQSQQNQQSVGQTGSFMSSQTDSALCNDMLMTEKFVSGAYDTAIFEMADKNVRQVLNHIQKEEQEHGEGLYNYMKSNGMYNAQ